MWNDITVALEPEPNSVAFGQLKVRNFAQGLAKKYKGVGRWGGGVEVFQSVVVRKHMTDPYHLAQNWVTHPCMKVEKYGLPTAVLFFHWPLEKKYYVIQV